MRWILIIIALLTAPTSAGEVWQISINGAIGPAVADLVVRNIEDAGAAGADAVILEMNTPGGLDLSMRAIIQAILASKIPVISYVSPKGSRAASAGTYILYASHIAAMAPATNLGAATPVEIGGGMPGPPDDDNRGDAEKSGDGEKPAGNDDGVSSGSGSERDAKSSAQAMRNKVVNDARAYIRSLAELRGRNVEWAERAVTEAATLTAKEALAKNVIDVIAEDAQSLLAEISGREVTIAGKPHLLDTENATIVVIEPDWRARVLAVITNPSVAYILMIVGIYGLILEFYNPGIGAGGIIGAICLLVALYAMQLLPISYSALALLVFGLGLMAAEAFSPSFGILGLGGIAAFIIGSVMLMDTDLPGFQIALPVILALAVASAGMLVLVLGLLLKARKAPVTTGLDTLLGRQATVVDTGNSRILVRLDGELWHARCDLPLATGDTVRVREIDGLTLHVTKED